MKLKTACFLAKSQITAFCDIKLVASNLVATKPKDGLGKIKGQKRSFGSKERKSLFPETPFSGAISLQHTHNFTANRPKHFFVL